MSAITSDKEDFHIILHIFTDVIIRMRGNTDIDDLERESQNLPIKKIVPKNKLWNSMRL